MDLALLLENEKDYRGRKIRNYQFTWGSTKNGLINAQAWLAGLGDRNIEYVYFGNEFCEYRIPTICQLKNMSLLCERDGVKLVLVTPPVTDYGIGKLCALFEYASGLPFALTVVVNDVGTLELLRQSGVECEIILGRILDRTSHDSRASMEDMMSYYGESGITFARTPGISSKHSLDVFKNYGLHRLEFDLPPIGLVMPKNIHCSLYWPYNYLTTGRVCMFRSLDKTGVEKYLVGDRRCTKKCELYQVEKRKPLNGYLIEQGERVSEIYLFQRGNTLFYLNDSKVNEQNNNQFDRLVIQL